MIELCVIVEGPTEEGFVRDVLVPHLRQCEVESRASVVGKPGHKGGVRSYQRIQKHLRNWMGDRRPTLRFTTMIDLYKLPSDFPGFEDSSGCPRPDERVRALETALAKKIDDPRFIPYVQLHEFEALLLANPTKFATFFLNHERNIRKLEKLVRNKRPELIDDDDPPSKQIASVLTDYAKAKPVAGPQIASAIGIATIREKCPHFNEWLAGLEALGKTSISVGN